MRQILTSKGGIALAYGTAMAFGIGLWVSYDHAPPSEPCQGCRDRRIMVTVSAELDKPVQVGLHQRLVLKLTPALVQQIAREVWIRNDTTNMIYVGSEIDYPPRVHTQYVRPADLDRLVGLAVGGGEE